MPERIDTKLFAPCGMNCLVCYVHLKKKKPCVGCLNSDENKPERCRNCKIKDCVQKQGLAYCYECLEFPCKQIKNLEKSYLKRYTTSLIDNSKKVQTDGILLFMASEREKWICKKCSGVISLHDGECSVCNAKYNS